MSRAIEDIAASAELLAHILHHESDPRTFRLWACICRAMNATINSAAFLRLRAILARAGLPTSIFTGASYLDSKTKSALEDLRCFLPHTKELLEYLKWTRCIDFSAGAERKPLTLDTRLHVEGVELFSEMRDACLCLAHREWVVHNLDPQTALFIYDSGPRPCPWLMQIFRAGAPGALNYGLRTLEPIPKGAFVCTYWGLYRSFNPNDDGANHPYAVQVQAYDDEPAANDLGPFWVDAGQRGNLARWINDSSIEPQLNLEPRLEPPQKLSQHPLIALHAKRDIAAGEQLFWDYRSGPVGDDLHYYMPGQLTKYSQWNIDGSRGPSKQDELLKRTDGTLLAATWALQQVPVDHPEGTKAPREDVLLVQGLPPGPGASASARHFHSLQEGFLQQLPAMPAASEVLAGQPLRASAGGRQWEVRSWRTSYLVVGRDII